MGWSSLIVSADAEALETLVTVSQELAIAGEARADIRKAIEVVASQNYDLLICDCDTMAAAGGHDLLRNLRAVSANAKLVVIALVSDADAMQSTFQNGANFVIHKPLTREVVRRTLRAAACVLLRSARRFPRREVKTLALVEIDGACEKAMLTELCEGGMAMQALELLEVRRPLHLHFQLPGSQVDVEARGEIAWADASGRVGVRFLEIDADARTRVREWVVNESLDQAAAALSQVGERPPARTGIGLRSGHPRLLAALLDGAVVLAATALFETLVLGLTRTAPHTLMAQATLFSIPCLFWIIYQYLFLHGWTPGARLARRLMSSVAGTSDTLVDWSSPVTLHMAGDGAETPAVTISR